MVEINEQILEAYGIYKTRNLENKEKENLLKIKKEIEKVINIAVERLYVINESAWGKELENAQLNICVLVDKRYKDIKEAREKLVKYAEEKDIAIMFWTLCQFEIRKNMTTEKDYYIERYGIKVYDSGKKTEINENLQVSRYAEFMDAYRFVRKLITLWN